MTRRLCSGRGPRHRITDLTIPDTQILKVISTLFILLPIVLNLARLKESGLFGRIFFCFLLLGLTTDLAFWYMSLRETRIEPTDLFNVYALVEALFFFWLIRSLTRSKALKLASEVILGVVPVAWCLFLAWPIFDVGKTGQSAPFVVSYEVVAAFLSGFALLALAEGKEQLWSSSSFWFLLGVFFYCFCTFFVMTFLGKRLLENLWHLNNVINMLTYLCYSLGWLRYDKQKLESFA